MSNQKRKTHMQTLNELIEAKKCRKGKAHGITSDGAYWLAMEPVKIRSYGGDGIGNNGVSWDHHLQIRHYRSGAVEAVVHTSGWHQNSGKSNEYHAVSIGECETVEQVIVKLKSMKCDGAAAYSDRFQSELTSALVSIGMIEPLPSPDDQV